MNKVISSKKYIKPIAKLSIFSLLVVGLIVLPSEKPEPTIKDIKLEQEIKDYDEYLDNYVSSNDFSNLTDLEIIMKVMNDTWSSIEGYKTPELDFSGYPRLDIMNGLGVSRNFVDDFNYKLNAINPEYHAHPVAVKEDFVDYEIADIKVNVCDDSQEDNLSKFDKIKREILGNHVISLVDIPNTDIILAVDPTNPSIGVYKNGKIKMFNNESSKITVKEFTTGMVMGYEAEDELYCDFVESLFIKEEYDELNKEYGIEAQNRALKKLNMQ